MLFFCYALVFVMDIVLLTMWCPAAYPLFTAYAQHSYPLPLTAGAGTAQLSSDPSEGQPGRTVQSAQPMPQPACVRRLQVSIQLKNAKVCGTEMNASGLTGVDNRKRPRIRRSWSFIHRSTATSSAE